MAESPLKLAVHAPATGARIGEVDCADREAVSRAIDRARSAEREWSARSLTDRCERVLGWRDQLVDQAERLVDVLVAECGKPRIEALFEVLVAVDAARYYAKHAPRALAPRDVEVFLLRHRRSYVHYTPLGVVGIVSPWNFPFVIPICDVFAALVAGNAVVLKPSELTPLIALEAKRTFDESGLPPNLFQVVVGGGEVGAALIDAGIDKLVFTGSVANGRKVAAACGERLVPCVLELGGKAPAIVCRDANLERTAHALVFGGFMNSGQLCLSVERVYAHASVYPALVNRVVELTSELRQGDPAAGPVDVGAMISSRQIDIVQRLVDGALAEGARLEIGGKRRRGAGLFYEPTVLSECSQSMAIMRDEIFGPVLPIMPVRDDEHALELANDSSLGLAGYVFSRDRERARRLAERVRAGMVMVNDVVSAYAVPDAPFGGVRKSGIGHVRGEDALRAMCETRHISYGRFSLGSREPYWYPHRDATYRALLKGMRLLYRRASPIKRLLDLL